MRPTLFSEKFGIAGEKLDSANLLDPFVDADTPLFIDPLLIDKSSNEVLRTDGLSQFRAYFDKVVRLLAVAEEEGDPAWKGAEKLLSLKEPAENGLGYSRSKRAGSSRPEEVRAQLLRTIKHVIRLGSKDPEMLSLMGFLEVGVGPDTISDFTTIAMTEALARITHEFCSRNSVPLFANDLSKFTLPLIVRKGRERPVVLVPRDVLRDLPVTESWGDVWEAAEHNRVLREKLSVMLAGIAQPTVAEQKDAIKRAVTRSAEVFDAFLEAVKSAATSYDQNEDIKGFFTFRDFLRHNHTFETGKSYDVRKSPDQVLKLILDVLDVFKHNVENGNLWEALWAGNQPKRERAAQLLFFAIADAYCRAHRIDNVSEPNFGGGPVDFAFGDGCDSRVIVEMKRSIGSVVSGYEKQIDRYKKAARTDYAIFVVIDYGRGAQKIRAIQRIRERKVASGERASEIIVIDARKKLSPSELR
jgi:hypothetical protein